MPGQELLLLVLGVEISYFFFGEVSLTILYNEIRNQTIL
jgi:hypothetical protein